MSGTYYSENKILDIYFGSSGSTTPPPTTWYVGLSTTTPTEAGGNVTEPVGNGYARRPFANTKSNFTVAASGSLTSASAIQFAESTGSWGTITHVLFYDAVSSGNLWFWEALSTPRSVAALTTVYFASGALTVSQNNV